MDHLETPQWELVPDADWFFPETSDYWAMYYRKADGVLFVKRIDSIDSYDDGWELANGERIARFKQRLAKGQLIPKPKNEGENSWLDSPA